ncbi:MAG: hypothetical protein VB957_18130 [Pseudomonadales bacterium]
MAVIDAVRDAGLEGNTMLLAFEWDLLFEARKICPELRTDFLKINPEFMINTYKRLGSIDPNLLYGQYQIEPYGSAPAAIAAAGGDGWGPYIHDVTISDVRHAHNLGLEVNLWGVDSSDEPMDAALALSADSITLSRPDLLQNKIDLM